MSMRYKGAVISATPPTLSPNAGGSGAWTLEQQMQANAAGLWPKNGPFNYIEDVFSTWLYTGTGSTQTINNGIDLAGKGGLVWAKIRQTGSHQLHDTARGINYSLYSDDTSAQDLRSDFSSLNANGFTLTAGANINASGSTYVSWTFREQPKFFDVVTWTGDSTSAQTISHNLGSVPGCIIVKRIDTATNWIVYHRGMNGGTNPLDFWMKINLTDAQSSGVATNFWANTNPTATDFTVGPSINSSSGTYVAYVFAHNAGGFGLTGTDNVISCGSYTGNGSTSNAIDLGYEPQWIMIKRATGTATDWLMLDTMRGWTVSPNNAQLVANTAAGEQNLNSSFSKVAPSATGFFLNTASSDTNASGATYIYIAIRRGPMAVPTTGTSVFSPVLYSGNSGNQSITAGFPVDMEMIGIRNGGGNGWEQGVGDRLRGSGRILGTAFTDAENNWSAFVPTEFQSNTGTNRTGDYLNFSGLNFADWMFRRAPGFFDVVCYTGTGSATTFAHNLGVAPELMIIKQRNAATDWWVIDYPLNGTLQLNNPYPINSPIPTNLSTGATATTFSLGTYSQVNGSGGTYVAYLFATCAGVSKVGSYTGTGTTQVINCGFTGGARFVMIKRADDTGLYTEGWYVWDSARGIVAGNDPYLLLNNTAAEVTNTDFIDTASTGFEISSTAPAAINGSGGTFIFLAIA